MAKFRSKAMVLLLSLTSFFPIHSSFLPPTVFATENQTEISRREEEGMLEFSEERLYELVVERSGVLNFEEELIYTIEEMEEFFDAVFIPLTQEETIVEADLLEVAPTPSYQHEVGTDTMYTWVAVGELEVVTVEAHTSKSGVMINLSKSYHSPKMFLPLLMTEDELLKLKNEEAALEDLVNLLGEPEQTKIRDGGLPTYFWQTLGGTPIPAEDITQLEITTNAEGEIQEVNYRIFDGVR